MRKGYGRELIGLREKRYNVDPNPQNIARREPVRIRKCPPEEVKWYGLFFMGFAPQLGRQVSYRNPRPNRIGQGGAAACKAAEKKCDQGGKSTGAAPAIQPGLDLF